jgi:preprotein translocase subunit SecE
MAADISERVGIPIFNKAYLQASVAAFFLLGGATLIYWFVAVRPGTVDFLVDTDGEMKKVNWSTRKAILDTTWVVIAATFLIAAALYIFDVLWSEFMRVVGVLHA